MTASNSIFEFLSRCVIWERAKWDAQVKECDEILEKLY